jgi:hypothetical protein
VQPDARARDLPFESALCVHSAKLPVPGMEAK